MKKTPLKTLLSLSFAVCLIALAAGGALGGEKAAMEKAGQQKAFFDVRDGDPKMAALHVGLIYQTYKDMAKGGAEKPAFVVNFMGPSVKLISKTTAGFSDEEKKSLEEIAAAVSGMSKDGIKLEVCIFAAKAMGVDPASILPEVKHVENGWISEIEHQSRGYSLVPVY